MKRVICLIAVVVAFTLVTSAVYAGGVGDKIKVRGGGFEGFKIRGGGGPEDIIRTDGGGCEAFRIDGGGCEGSPVPNVKGGGFEGLKIKNNRQLTRRQSPSRRLRLRR